MDVNHEDQRELKPEHAHTILKYIIWEIKYLSQPII